METETKKLLQKLELEPRINDLKQFIEEQEFDFALIVNDIQGDDNESDILEVVGYQLHTKIKSIICNEKLMETSITVKMDNALNIYYQNNGINDYMDTNHSEGKFLKFIEEQGFDEESVEMELAEDVETNDCLLLDFDHEFPINADILISNDGDKKKIIHHVLQFCMENFQPPSIQQINEKMNAFEQNSNITELNDKSPNIGINLDVLELKRSNESNNISDYNYLEEVVRRYTRSTNVETINIKKILNEYLQLIQQIDDDNKFESLYKRFGGGCDIHQCHIFDRDHRDRYKLVEDKGETQKIYDVEDSGDNADIVSKQILDKIHCYFKHSYDTGYRLSVEEKKIVQAINKSDNQYDDKLNEYLLNKQILKIRQIISNKQQKHHNSSRNSGKFIFGKCDEKQVNEEIDTPLYSFGYYFGYDDKCHHPHVSFSDTSDYDLRHEMEMRPRDAYFYAISNSELRQDWHAQYIGPIQYKYKDLKEELTANAISVINMAQFMNEIKKAMLHYESNYCKQHIMTHRIRGQWREKDLSLNDILSVMIYCNYTMLQYEFSKTYRKIKHNETRDEVKQRHRHFYWFGRFLKECVNQYGWSTIHGGWTDESHVWKDDVFDNSDCDEEPSYVWKDDHSKKTVLYHGLGEKLKFPSVTGRFRGIRIYGPVSTSSSFEVAVNFTNHNNGLIVEFVEDPQQLHTASIFFSCSWLSDYANEREYLYIQNDGYFVVENLYDPVSGVEFRIILWAIKLFNAIIQPDDEMHVRRGGTLENIYSHYTENTILAVVYALIEDQLITVDSQRYSKYKTFETIHSYGKILMRQFCDHQKYVDLNYCSYLSVLAKYFWINGINEHTPNTKLIKDLFPNLIETIHIKGNRYRAPLSEFKKKHRLMQCKSHDILQYFQAYRSNIRSGSWM